MTEPRVGPGSVLELAEPDYCYGVGPLALRVEEVGADPASFHRLDWVRIVGSEVRWNADGERREVMVRVRAIAQCIRPPDWRPARFPS